MASTSLFLCLFFLLSPTFLPSKSHSLIDPINGDFSISLIHRDSPRSPLFNNSMTPYERNLAAAHHSISRLKYLHLRKTATSSESEPPEISSTLVSDYFEYIVTYNIGTPPTPVHAILDTSSDLIWTKGLTCFDPSESATYSNLSCDSGNCVLFGSQRTTCTDSSQPCTYHMRYVDGSETSGVLSYDKFAFDSPDGTSEVDVGYLQFGCSNWSSPEFKEKETGVLGLNRERFSLISQLGIKKFSHCMIIPEDKGSAESRIYFGSRAVICPGDLTPIVKGIDSSYYVALDGISIGEAKVPIPEGVFHITGHGDGGVMVDCGVTLTVLVAEGYEPFLNMMRLFVHKPTRNMSSSRRGDFELCFKGKSEDLGSIPEVTFHFSGVDVKLMQINTFVEVEIDLVPCDSEV